MERLTNVDTDSDTTSVKPDLCHLCECEFSLDDEGGACGHIGVLLVVLCPVCHTDLYDLYRYRNWHPKNKD